MAPEQTTEALSVDDVKGSYIKQKVQQSAVIGAPAQINKMVIEQKPIQSSGDIEGREQKVKGVIHKGTWATRKQQRNG